MPLLSLPTRAPGIDSPTAIGGVKSNARPFTEDKRYLKIPADEYNRILSYLIDVCDTVGLTSGATPGSLWEAVLSGGGGTGLEAGIVASPDFFSGAGAFSTTTRVHVGSGTGYVRQLPAAPADYYSWTLVYTGTAGQSITIGRNGGSINGMLGDYTVTAAEGVNRIVRIEGGPGGIWRVAEQANWPEVEAAISTVAGDLAALTTLVGAADGSTPGSAWESIQHLLAGRNPNVQLVTSADMVNATASLVVASSTGYALAMPASGGITMHREIRLLYTGGGSITLTGNGGTLNGAATVTLGAGAAGTARYVELVLRPGGAHFASAPLGAMSTLSVAGNPGATLEFPQEISTTPGSGAVLRESGGSLGFGTISAGGLAPNSVTDTILRDSAALSVIGRASNTSGDPADIAAGTTTGPLRSTGVTLGFRKDNYAATVAPTTANDAAQSYEIGSVWVDTVADRVYVATDVSVGAAVWRETSLAPNSVTDTILRDSGPLSVIGRSVNSSGDPADISATAASGAVLRESGSVIGFGQVATAGVADNAIDNTKIRDSGALSVIGRSANSSGDPADIAATAASDAVLRESGSTLGFGTVATGGIANNAVTDAKFRQGGALTVVGRSANTVGNVADITATAASGAVLRESASTIGFGTVATAGIADNAVTNLKIRDAVALSVIGRSANSTGDPADIAATAASGAVLREASNVLGFGTVATAGITDDAITNAKLANMAALTVKANATNAAADPADLAATAASGAVLRESGSTLGFGTVATAGIANNAIDNTKIRDSGALSVIGRATNTAGDPADISATAASNAVLKETGSTLAFGLVTTANVTANAVDNTLIRDSGALSVIGRSANSSGDPADISAPAASGAVLRESGSSLGFGTVATAGIGDDQVTDAKLRNASALSVIGRASNSSGDPADILAGANTGPLRSNATTLAFRKDNYAATVDPSATDDSSAGYEVGSVWINTTAQHLYRCSSAASLAAVWIRLDNTDIDAGLFPSGSIEVVSTAAVTIAAATRYVRSTYTGGTQTLTLRGLVDHPVGKQILLGHESTSTNAIVIQPDSGSSIGSGAADAPFTVPTSNTPASSTTPDRLWSIVRVTSTLWRVLGPGLIESSDLAANAVTDTALRDSAALSVIGRATNSSGDPGDISTTAASNAVLKETGSTLAFGLVTTANVTANAVDNTLIRDSGALSVIGRSANSSGDPADISAVAASGAVLRESGSVLGFGTVATAGIANDAIDNTKIRDSGALSVIGRSANTSGDPADISATAASGAVLRESGSVLGFGTVATAGIGDAQVTDAKLRNSVALSVIGRSANATGVPADISTTAASGAVLRESGSALGFGTVATAGIANDAVDNTKIRNSGALSVIGRSANTAGDPADISATAASNAVLKETGSTLAFGLVTTANVTTNAIDNTLIRDSGALSVIGRSANTSGDPADISAVAASGAVLRESGSALGFGTVATAGIANDAIDNTKIRNSGALSVIGRSANSSGDPADISATASSDQVLRESAGVLGFGQVATAGLANGVVEAKLAAASAAVAFNSQRLTTVADPVSAQDVATKAYVDAVAQSLDVKASVRATSTTNITLSGPQVIDGVSIIAGDSVLVQGQTLGETNGIYVAAAGAWARRNDADTSAKVTSGLYTFVTEGTANGSNGYVLTTPDPIVLGTTVLTFTQFSGAGMIIAGAGLTKSGNTLNVGAGTGITVNADDVAISVNGVTDTLLRDSVGVSVIGRSVNSSGDPGDIVASADGQFLRRSAGTVGFGVPSTSEVTEGANLYFTDTRARDAFSNVATVSTASATLGTEYLNRVTYSSGTCALSLPASTTTWPVGVTRRIAKSNTSTNQITLAPPPGGAINAAAADAVLILPGCQMVSGTSRGDMWWDVTRDSSLAFRVAGGNVQCTDQTAASILGVFGAARFSASSTGTPGAGPHAYQFSDADSGLSWDATNGVVLSVDGAERIRATVGGATEFVRTSATNTLISLTNAAGTARLMVGNTSPEGAATASPGAVFFDVANGRLYLKRTGTGNTGWEPLDSTSTVATVNAASATMGVEWLTNVTYSAGTCALTLPVSTTTWPVGVTRRIKKKNTSSNTITLAPNAGGAINGNAADAVVTLTGSALASNTGRSDMWWEITRIDATTWDMIGGVPQMTGTGTGYTNAFYVAASGSAAAPAYRALDLDSGNYWDATNGWVTAVDGVDRIRARVSGVTEIRTGVAAASAAVLLLGNSSADARVFVYPGTPEGVLTADPGDFCSDATNGRFYIKRSGASSTGWLELNPLGYDVNQVQIITSGTSAVISNTARIVLVSTAAGAFSLTAPALTVGATVEIYKTSTDGNAITIVRTSTETINGVAANYLLTGSDSTAGYGRWSLTTTASLARVASALLFGTANIVNNSVTDVKLRDSGALSVIGRSVNSAGAPADISAVAASGAVLRESGSVLGFGTVATAGIANDAIDNTKIRNSGALSVIGRSANSAGDPADISAVAASGAVLRESGSVLGFGQVAQAGVSGGYVDLVNPQTIAGIKMFAAVTTSKGGEIRLEKGSASTLAGNAAIDLFNQSIRIFENGGTFRGVNLDLTAAAAGAASVLWHSGNDGPGSGLDADTLDGVQGSGYVQTTRTLSTGPGLSIDGGGSADLSANRSIGIIVNGVNDTMIRQGTPLTVIGRSANSTGNVADIAAVAASGAVLRESGSTIGFGTVATAGIADSAVTEIKTGFSTATVAAASATLSGAASVTRVTYAAGTCTLTLPASTAQWPVGTTKRIRKENTSTFTIVLTPDSGGTINGGAANASVTLNGSNLPSATTLSDMWWDVTRDATSTWRYVSGGARISADGPGHMYFTLVVGNALEGDTLDNCDYVDPGDGTGILAALTALYSLRGTVRIRRGQYTMGAAMAPFELSAGISVVGEGRHQTIITAPAGNASVIPWRAFNITGVNAEVSDLTIRIPDRAATIPALTTPIGVITVAAPSSTVRRVLVDIILDFAVAEQPLAAVVFSSITDYHGHLIEDVTLSALNAEPVGHGSNWIALTTIAAGDLTAPPAAPYSTDYAEPIFNRVRFVGAKNSEVGNAYYSVGMISTSLCQFRAIDCEFLGVYVGLLCSWNLASGTASAIGPHVTRMRVVGAEGLAASSIPSGASISLTDVPTGLYMHRVVLENCTSDSGTTGSMNPGYAFTMSALKITGVEVQGCIARTFVSGVPAKLDLDVGSSGTSSRIAGVRLESAVGVTATNVLTIGTGDGAHVVDCHTDDLVVNSAARTIVGHCTIRNSFSDLGSDTLTSGNRVG